MGTAPMLRRPHHQAATCTDATAHPRRGHHRTTSYMSCSVRSPGRRTPHRQARHPGTTALSPRSHFPLLPSTRHTPRCHSTRLGLFAGKSTFPISAVTGTSRFLPESANFVQLTRDIPAGAGFDLAGRNPTFQPGRRPRWRDLHAAEYTSR
jgi:hypothetical protein